MIIDLECSISVVFVSAVIYALLLQLNGHGIKLNFSWIEGDIVADIA